MEMNNLTFWPSNTIKTRLVAPFLYIFMYLWYIVHDKYKLDAYQEESPLQ